MRPRVCLNMIVKNESRIIERCLASVLPWVSCVAILDTGSTDDTLEKIAKACDAARVPGPVSSGPFESFRSARERALLLARETCEKHDASHILLIDADMRLVVSDPNGWLMLEGDSKSFSIAQKMGDILYDNVRVVRADSKATYEGKGTTRTHEVCVGEGIFASLANRLPGILIDDRGDGASHAEKFERDIRLLKEDLAEDPDNERAMFYLAETLRNSGKTEEALTWYAKREAADGFHEEKWYAGFMVVRCLLAQKKLDEALSKAILVFEKNPERAEPLVETARAFREAGRNEIASFFADRALDIRQPMGGLFVDVPAHTWGAKQEASIASFYSHSRRVQERGRESCYALSIDPTVPDHVRNLARSNTRHWARPLRELVEDRKAMSEPKAFPHFDEDRRPFTALAEHWNDAKPHWRCMNPSVFVDKKGELKVALRHVNYSIDDRGSYIIRDADGIVKTRTGIVRLDPETLAWEDFRWIRESDEAKKSQFNTGRRVQGFEDLRPFVRAARQDVDIWALATTLQNTEEGRAQVVLLEIVDEGEAYEIRRVHKQEQKGHQKNWLPIVDVEKEDKARILFSTAHATVMRLDACYTYVTERSSPTKTLCLEGFRGGSQLIPIAENMRVGAWDAADQTGIPGIDTVAAYLYVVHEAHDTGGMRAYTHRFVLLDLSFKVKSVSDPFVFGSGQSIEFCAGLACLEEDAFLSYGARDAVGYVVRLPIAECVRLAGRWKA